VHPVAVTLAGPDAGQVGVPAVRVEFLKADPAFGAQVVEQAQLDGLRGLGEQ
jgi:hypothetical protein